MQHSHSSLLLYYVTYSTGKDTLKTFVHRIPPNFSAQCNCILWLYHYNYPSNIRHVRLPTIAKNNPTSSGSTNRRSFIYFLITWWLPVWTLDFFYSVYTINTWLPKLLDMALGEIVSTGFYGSYQYTTTSLSTTWRNLSRNCPSVHLSYPKRSIIITIIMLRLESYSILIMHGVSSIWINLF